MGKLYSKLSFEEVNRRFHGRNFCFMATQQPSCKTHKKRRFTFQNEIFIYSYPHSNALLQIFIFQRVLHPTQSKRSLQLKPDVSR